MTRMAPYGSAEWRRWKHQHHWATPAGPPDPLGAGNTALIGASGLNITPFMFYDVRQHLTVASGTASSLADVKGDGTYGPALTQGTQANQPAWDGTTLSFDGTHSLLVSSSSVPGLDLSTQLTLALIIDVKLSGTSATVCQAGAAGNTAPNWNLKVLSGGGAITVNTSTHGAATISTAVSGTGNLRLILITLNVVGTDAQSIEVPNTAKVNGTTAAALPSGNQLIAIGGTTAGALAPLRFRALIGWPGGYTTGQRDTLKTYASTFHGMALA